MSKERPSTQQPVFGRNGYRRRKDPFGLARILLALTVLASLAAWDHAGGTTAPDATIAGSASGR